MAIEDRFAFGENWAAFLSVLNEKRVSQAEESLKARLHIESLVGKCFLDIGSGSGLSSLAARRLGARVHSFDYDVNAVACTQELRRQYFPDDQENWLIQQGSVLDRDYLSRLGQFDIVYSWGVLHHTGSMWAALANVAQLVRPDGVLFISIYNDQGWKSDVWRWVKRTYNQSPRPVQKLLVGLSWARFNVTRILLRRRFADRGRGMSESHDLIDWVGGYPFEVATPQAILAFFRERGFVIRDLKTVGNGIACNEFVFQLWTAQIPINGLEPQYVAGTPSRGSH
jgi:SAM-dependent methyltransferase